MEGTNTSTPFFAAAFEALEKAHRPPLRWQTRLYDRLVQGSNHIPGSCCLPTGLGKTSVIPIWLIAMAAAAARTGPLGDAPPVRLPRRLVYIVNRRTVVDQATDDAERYLKLLTPSDDKRRHTVLHEMWPSDARPMPEDELPRHVSSIGSLWQALALLTVGHGADPQTAGDPERLKAELRRACGEHAAPLAISTLRGQLADNGEWSADPARPAIIIGTVDMIGSRLLFSGYGRGFKHRPLHAGFLGQDTLLVHDEAHLEPAFQELLDTVREEQTKGRCRDYRPLRVMAMTATPRTKEDAKPFELEDADYEEDAIIKQRLDARKSIALHPIDDEKKVAETLTALALKRAQTNPDSAILVFVRKVEDVKNVVEALKKKSVLADKIEPLTGTIRGKERDDLVEKPVFQRFLPKSNRIKGVKSAEGTVFLVCTSAGEVGVDISADHLVCDLTPFDSMAQRFGRVNRFGDGDAMIDVVHPKPKEFGESGAGKEYQARREKTLELLTGLPVVGNNQQDGLVRRLGSPKALGEALNALKKMLQTEGGKQTIEDIVFSPKPTTLAATDILFDAWALTSIREKLPGRPEVAPYLHGIADDQPQTTIAWRAELDLIGRIDPQASDAKKQAEKSLQAIFAKHRIRPHETLTVGMSSSRGKWNFRAIEFLEQAVDKRPDLHNSTIAIQFVRGIRLSTVGQLIKNPGSLNADPMLILPASFGGLNDKGMLSADAIPEAPTSRTESEPSADESSSISKKSDTTVCWDVADFDVYGSHKDPQKVQEGTQKTRMRVLIKCTNEEWMAEAVPCDKALPDWKLTPPYKKSTELVNQIRIQSGLNVRLVQTLRFNDNDEPTALICLSPPPRGHKNTSRDQSLAEHVGWVEQEAKRLADALLHGDKAARAALLFAAEYHDKGKEAKRWQDYIGGPDANGRPLGKSAEWRDPKRLAGYRHEFGSLLRITDEESQRFFADSKWNLTPDEQKDVRDLALHLIAAHHGYARPHFLSLLDGDIPATYKTPQCEQTHIDVIRRFARLQRRYGRWGLAYLESLLRAADIAASRAVGFDAEVDDDAGESDAVDGDDE